MTMGPRTFVITVSDLPSRVIVEDVRSRTRALADGLDGVGREIARLLEAAAGEPAPALDVTRGGGSPETARLSARTSRPAGP